MLRIRRGPAAQGPWISMQDGGPVDQAPERWFTTEVDHGRPSGGAPRFDKRVCLTPAVPVRDPGGFRGMAADRGGLWNVRYTCVTLPLHFRACV